MINIKEKLSKIPHLPGVYLMKDKKAKVIYVGKAKDLNNRVKSYFLKGSGDKRFFIAFLEDVLEDIEILLTQNEKEAFILEDNLIKEFNPKYNVKLKDDKDFLYIMIDLNKKWPALQLIRRPLITDLKGKKLFGPYHSARSARRTAKIASRYFQIRDCSDHVLSSRKRPCIQHQLKYCSAPCTKYITEEEYFKRISYAEMFLSGHYEELIKIMLKKMNEASGMFEYERAAFWRDQIKAIETSMIKQRIVINKNINEDVIGYFRDNEDIEIVILQIREGKIIQTSSFHYSNQKFPDEEIISSFILQYFSASESQEDILIPWKISSMDSLEEILSERTGKKIKIKAPKKTQDRDVINFAMENARNIFVSRRDENTLIKWKLDYIKNKLHLGKIPNRMECVDISHLSGTLTVGAISVFVDGKYRGDLCRLFKIHENTHGDDYLAMYEVLSRRFKHAIDTDKNWELPDLLVVDGGKGQLNIALTVLNELKINGIDLVSIAKGKERKEDQFYIPGSLKSIKLLANSPLNLIAQLRDQAHRLALKQQKKERNERDKESMLDEITGIGNQLKKKILTYFKDIEKIKRASIEELRSVPGIGDKTAYKIYNHFIKLR